jgi:hypothetical protein
LSAEIQTKNIFLEIWTLRTVAGSLHRQQIVMLKKNTNTSQPYPRKPFRTVPDAIDLSHTQFGKVVDHPKMAIDRWISFRPEEREEAG